MAVFESAWTGWTEVKMFFDNVNIFALFFYNEIDRLINLQCFY